MSRAAAAIEQISILSPADTELLALVECLRARSDLDADRHGTARLEATTAILLIRGMQGEPSGRVLVRVLASTAQLAYRSGDILTARSRAREAVTIAGAALGPDDPDTAIAWQVLAQSCAAAGDTVAASAALRRAQAARDSQNSPDLQTPPNSQDWLW
jgi:predicted Zn-dependent protease